MSLSRIIWFVVVTIAVLLISLTVAHLSLWFIWALLPPGDVHLAVNQTQAGADQITNYLTPNILSAVSPYLSATRRFAISSTSTTITFLAVPAEPLLFKGQNQLTARLIQDGWQVQRLGLIIMAQQDREPPSNSLASVSRAYLQLAREIIQWQRPLRPVIIAALQTNALPFLNNPLAVIGTARQIDSQTQEIIFMTDSQLSQLGRVTAPSLPTREDELFVALPSQTLDELPAIMHQQFSQAISAQLGFINTQPDLTRQLLQHQAFQIASHDQSIVIAVQGNPQAFITAVEQWTSAEETRTRLQQRAFRLPDGTLGYEKIPGPPRDLFTSVRTDYCRSAIWATADNQQSDAATPNDTVLWLCARGAAASLSTEQRLARQAVDSSVLPGNQWHIRIGQSYTRSLSLDQLTAISATGSGDQTTIRARRE